MSDDDVNNPLLWTPLPDAFRWTQDTLGLSHNQTNTLLLEALKAAKIRSKGHPVRGGDGMDVIGMADIQLHRADLQRFVALFEQNRAELRKLKRRLN
jgi:hypothetical protein